MGTFITLKGHTPSLLRIPDYVNSKLKHISQPPEVDKNGPSCILPIFLLHTYVDTMWIYTYGRDYAIQICMIKYHNYV